MLPLLVGTLLSLLTVSVISSQYLRKEASWHGNDWHEHEQSLVNSDTLTNVDLVQQLSSGQITAGEWVSSRAPYWHTEILPTWVLMTLTGGRWRLTMAMYSVMTCLLVT